MNTVSMTSRETLTTQDQEMAHGLHTSQCEQGNRTETIHRGEDKMFSIFASNDSTTYTAILLDAHTTSPGQEESVIVRNDQRESVSQRDSEIYARARRIYYRGRRTSLSRGAGIL